MAVRLDGKTVRGAKDAAGNQRHLLAALAGHAAQSSVVAAQAEVGAKTNEVPMAKTVPGQIDLNGNLVTEDAIHTVKATAEFIRGGGGEFVLPVKENRKALFDALDALPWHEVPVAHSATGRGHRRITTHHPGAARAGGSAVPARQPGPAHRKIVSDLAGKRTSAVAASGVASPAADRVSAADLAGHVREQWSIGVSLAPCACSDAPMPSKPPDGPPGPWTGPSPSSASYHDLETAVAGQARTVGAEVGRCLLGLT